MDGTAACRRSNNLDGVLIGFEVTRRVLPGARTLA